jgi:hypothetical protein
MFTTSEEERSVYSLQSKSKENKEGRNVVSLEAGKAQ